MSFPNFHFFDQVLALQSASMGFTCCNDKQTLSIILIVLYAVLILKLWRLAIIHPFKILTVFLHELGHAIACWLTCGRVKGMEVHPNEGGVTKTSGGVQWIILMAGYVGSALWGMALIVASADSDTSVVAACVLMFFLALFIFFGNNSYLRILNACFIVLLVCLLLINIYTKYEPLQYVTLFMGVMSCLFSIYDIWDDLISRRVNQSDASVLAKLTHTSSRCWGLIWALIAIAALVAAVFLHLVIAKNRGGPVSIPNTSTATQVVFYCTIAVLVISVAHTAITKRVMVRKRHFGSSERGADGSYVCAA